MSQEPDKFLYFKVGLLKDSGTLNELWQDALKHHMVDRPDKLIALRLTEYYEIVSKGLLHPIAQVAQGQVQPAPPAAATPAPALPPAPTAPYNAVPSVTNHTGANGAANGNDKKYVSSASTTNHPNTSGPLPNPTAHPAPASKPSPAPAHNYQNIEETSSVAVIPGAEQNAEEAADYWNLL